MRHTLRKALLCGVLGFGSIFGVPMDPRQIEELMWATSRPKIAHTNPQEDDRPEWLKKLLRRLKRRPSP